MRQGRWLLLPPLLVLVVATLGAAEAQRAERRCNEETTLLVEVTSPFPRKSPIVDLVADRDRPGRLWATDGRVVRRSDDRGCSWNDTFDVIATGGSSGTGAPRARIIDLVSPLGDPEWLSAFVVTPVGSLPGTVEPAVATTRDGGRTWFTSTEGLPDRVTMQVPLACERTCGMVGTTDGDAMLTLWFTEPNGVSVYWTLSGGRNFTARSVPSTPLAIEFGRDTPASEMVIDQPGYFGLFGTRPDGATVSDDGGRTWNSWPEHFGDFGTSRFAFPDEATGRAADRPVDRYLVAELADDGQLVATHAKFQDVFGWTVSDAATVTGQLTGLGSVGDASLLLATTTNGIWVGRQIALDKVAWQLLVEVAGQRHVQSAGGLVWMHDDAAVRVIDPQVLPLVLDVPARPPTPADLDLPPFDPANPIGPLPGRLTVDQQRVVLVPGVATRIPVVLDVPAIDPRVDLFFLVSRNGSMNDELDRLAEEFFVIVKELLRRDVDVNVGIGVYGSQVRYHRYRDIGPADDRFKKVVEDIIGAGVPLSAFTALDAAMLGTIYPVSGDKFATYPGLETHWRPNATRVVLHVTDVSPFGNNDDASAAQAQAALQSAQALQLGLVVGGRGADDWRSMDALARASGAIATRPIDCNGDGLADVQPGDPIVCEYLSDNSGGVSDDLGLLAGLADVVVDILDAATAITPLAFHTTTPDLVTTFGPAAQTTSIDLLEATRLDAVATARCGLEIFGSTTTTRLSVTSGTRGLATTTLELVCGDTPVADAPRRRRRGASAVRAAQAAPSRAARPRRGQLGASNRRAQCGARAREREEQHQSAAIGRGDPQPDESVELAFSAFRSPARSTGESPLTLWMGAGMATGAAAVMARRARRVRVLGQAHTRP